MFTFGHLIGAWLLGKGFEKVSEKKLSRFLWFWLLFGALLPDSDYIVDWLFGTTVHRTLTHSLLFVVGAAVFFYFLLCRTGVCIVEKKVEKAELSREGSSERNSKRRSEKQALLLAYVFGAGIFSHLLLDMLFSEGVPFFWPSLFHIAFSHWGYFDPATAAFLDAPLASLRSSAKMMILDMGLGAAWIFYLWMRRRIQF